MVIAQEPLADLLRYLKAADYHFTTVTPATHAKVLARQVTDPLSLRDIFGWNRPFNPTDISPRALGLLRDAEAIEEQEAKLRSKVRVASLGEDLLLHSAFPTDDPSSVFFGPDTYRFVRFLQQQLPQKVGTRWLIDVGAGSGAGAIAAARSCTPDRVTLVDINPEALRLAVVNAAVARIEVDVLELDTIPSGAELIIANPPYMMDPAARSYRNGGELLGGAVALDWVSQALQRMAPGGMMLLYTGAAYINGESPLLSQLEIVCSDLGALFELEEIDPDVFGDELERPTYAGVERIAAVGVAIRHVG